MLSFGSTPKPGRDDAKSVIGNKREDDDERTLVCFTRVKMESVFVCEKSSVAKRHAFPAKTENMIRV